MIVNKFRVTVAVIVATLVGALVYQGRTISRLRADLDEGHKRSVGGIAKNSVAKKSVANAQPSEGKNGEARIEKSQMDEGPALASTAPIESVQPSAVVSVTAASGSEQGVGTPSAETKKSRERTRLHQRYDSFLQDSGLSDAQIDQFIELRLQQAEIREDLQAAVRDAGATGGTSQVEALRTELYQPITDQMRELLGEEGYRAYREFERTSFYRAAYIERMTPVFANANASLSAAQTEQLARIVAAHDHPVRKSATDLGTESRIDWMAVSQEAGPLLTAQQKQAMAVFVEQDQQRTAR